MLSKQKDELEFMAHSRRCSLGKVTMTDIRVTVPDRVTMPERARERAFPLREVHSSRSFNTLPPNESGAL